MGKSKQKALEAFMEMNLADTRVVEYKGTSWPYMINRFGTLWTTPFTEVKPYVDSESGYLMVTLRDNVDECIVPLHLLMATIYIDNPNGYTSARIKNGDPQVQKSYRPENIEWIEEEEDIPVDISDDDIPEQDMSEKDIASIIWCKYNLSTSIPDIAMELNINIDEVTGLLNKFNLEFMSKYQPIVTGENTKIRTMNKRFKLCRAFMIYLVNTSNADIPYIVSTMRRLIPEADDDRVKTSLRACRRDDARTKKQFRLKKWKPVEKK